MKRLELTNCLSYLYIYKKSDMISSKKRKEKGQKEK